MLTPDTQIVSVDDHVIEHPQVWLDRMPAKYKDVAPRNFLPPAVRRVCLPGR